MGEGGGKKGMVKMIHSTPSLRISNGIALTYVVLAWGVS